MSRRSLRLLVSAAIPVALTLAALWLHQNGPAPPGWSRPPRPPVSAPAPRGHWIRLEEASLVANAANDGDSFLLHHSGGDHVFRLYFVDCPEKRRHQFNGPRLAEQGAYFGGMTEAETLRIGEQARAFTLGLLGSGRIEVFTRWEPVFDERRHYAHLAVVEADGSRRWLAELLVENGLARIFTKGTDLPDGTREHPFAHHLRTLEKAARLARRGAWSQVPRETE